MRCHPLLFVLLSAPLAAADPTPQQIEQLTQAVASGDYGPITSLVIQQHGEVIYEQYFRGATADDVQLLNSATKSIGSALIGIAARQDRIDPADRLEVLFPDYDWGSGNFASRRDITVRDVLQMRHGVAWDELSTPILDARNPVAQMLASSDYHRYVLTRPVQYPPGQHFVYSTGVSTLMSGMIRRVSGLTPQAFAERHLFGPLGITAYHWETWHPNGRGSGTTNFPFGDAPLGIGLWLRPRDLARIGQMYLDGGVYDGQRILDEEWIRASWTVYSDAGTDDYFVQPVDDGFGYGYQWWHRDWRDARGRTHYSWYASGYGGQVLIVFPELDLVVASTADSRNLYTGPTIGTVLREFVLPALDLPPSPALAGSYFNPQMPGQGLNVEVLANGDVVAYWYTYAEGGHRWYVAQGRAGWTEVPLTVYRTTGGGFVDATPATLGQVGTATLRFPTCGTAHLSYSIDAGTGEYPLMRLTGACPSHAHPPR